MFEFKKCISSGGKEFAGLYEIQPKIFGDGRGYFFESYSEKDFFDAGLCMKFVQDNQSFSTKGVLRGLHFQTKKPQGKLVRAVSGKVFDVAVDLRNDSATFGEYFGVVLDAEKQNQFYIPKGFAHGFLVLTDSAIFAYKCTDFYDPTGEGGIPWNDRTISVNWNSGGNADFSPVISEKDKHHALFSPQKKYFDMDGNFCFQEGTCAD